jgi:hypothetical protein
MCRVKEGRRVRLDTEQRIASALGVESVELLKRRQRPAGDGLPPAPDHLPPLLHDFVGRTTEVDRLAEWLRGEGQPQGKDQLRVAAVRGMGGVGKTTLAVKVGHYLRPVFPHGRVAVDLDGLTIRPTPPVDAMARVIRTFRPELGGVAPDEAVDRYREVLAGRRVLLLLDNAADEAQVRPLLSVGPPVAFIVTSRNALPLVGAEHMQLDEFPKDEAVQFLRSLVGPKGGDGDLADLAHLCGYLPLALRVAGVYVGLNDDWTVPQYAAALRKKQIEWLSHGKDANDNVGLVLGLSLDRLAREDDTLLRRWARLGSLPGPFDVGVAQAVWVADGLAATDESEAKSALTRLVNRSLLQYDPAIKRYRLHDLFRLIAAERRREVA